MTVAARVGAAVDVGSNSIHLLVAALGRSRLRTLVDESVQLGFGSVVDREGSLTAEVRATGVAVLQGYVAQARALGADHITLLGTEPLRRASNRSAFLSEVLDATGVPLRVLSHEEEAGLTMLGVTAGRRPIAPLLVLDIGGGSTELIVAAPEHDPVVGALPTGSSRLAVTFVEHDPPTWEEISELRAVAVRLFSTMPQARPSRGIVAGGTGTNTNRLLGRIRLGALDPTLLDRAMTALATHPAASLAADHGLSERRIRQLPAGIALVEAALSRYGLPRFATSDASLREGAIHAAARSGEAWPEGLASLLGESGG
jgi:exopolyphosphatase/pppGpp-phosphohydrolase